LHTFDDIGTVGCDDVDMVRHDAWGESWNFDILEEDAPEQSHRPVVCPHKTCMRRIPTNEDACDTVLAEEGSNPK
jgi:hypothetical protein